MTQLVIFDLYGTIAKEDVFDHELRPGFQELSDHLGDIPKVVFSDISFFRLLTQLKDLGILHSFQKFYGAESGITDSKDADLEKLRFAGGIIKDLSLPLEYFGVHPNNAVLIGDNEANRDRASADSYGVRFLQVPQFRHMPVADSKYQGPVFYKPRNYCLTNLIGRI
jgi:hypothetical protein